MKEKKKRASEFKVKYDGNGRAGDGKEEEMWGRKKRKGRILCARRGNHVTVPPNYLLKRVLLLLLHFVSYIFTDKN
jgi:hypothetical protein